VVEGDGVVADLDLGLAVALGVHAGLGELLHFEGDDGGRGGLAALEAGEVALDDGLDFLGIEVADDDASEVVGAVVDVEVVPGLLLGVAVEIAGPADDGPVVGRALPEDGVELLLVDAGGGALGAEAALLVDDVALGVELAEDRVVEAVGLHPGPELELVGGDVDEVEGEVAGREGVHARSALGGVDLVELVVDDDGLVLLHQAVEFGAELLHLGGVVEGVPGVVDLAGGEAAVLLGEVEVEQLLADPALGVAELGILLGVVGPDGVGALEHHVLKEVADAGDARALVDRADLGDPAGGDDVGLIGAGDEEELHPVVEGEGLDLHLLPQGRDARRRHRRCRQEPSDHRALPGLGPSGRSGACWCIAVAAHPLLGAT